MKKRLKILYSCGIIVLIILFVFVSFWALGVFKPSLQIRVEDMTGSNTSSYAADSFGVTYFYKKGDPSGVYQRDASGRQSLVFACPFITGIDANSSYVFFTTAGENGAARQMKIYDRQTRKTEDFPFSLENADIYVDETTGFIGNGEELYTFDMDSMQPVKVDFLKLQCWTFENNGYHYALYRDGDYYYAAQSEDESKDTFVPQRCSVFDKNGEAVYLQQRCDVVFVDRQYVYCAPKFFRNAQLSKFDYLHNREIEVQETAVDGVEFEGGLQCAANGVVFDCTNAYTTDCFNRWHNQNSGYYCYDLATGAFTHRELGKDRVVIGRFKNSVLFYDMTDKSFNILNGETPECVSDLSLSNRKTYHAAFTGEHVLLYDADYNLLTVL